MQRTMRHGRGFTLLEIMVVMVIVAVLAAIAAPNLFAAKSRNRDLEREASMLATRIRVAQDEAMLYGQEFGLVFAEDGYRFVQWDPEKNRFARAGGTWAQRTLEESVRVSMQAEGDEPLLELPEPDKEKAKGKDTALDAADAAGEAEEPDWQPSVFVLSSGEVTPFTAIFSAEGAEQPLELRIDPLGNRLDPPGAAAPADKEADGNAG